MVEANNASLLVYTNNLLVDTNILLVKTNHLLNKLLFKLNELNKILFESETNNSWFDPNNL